MSLKMMGVDACASTYPLVSVVVVNFNGKNFLSDHLNSLLRSEYPNFEVIFVDNGSTDGSLELAIQRLGKAHHLNSSIIKNQTNLGFAEGCNIGAKHSKGKYIVFLNNDTKVDKYWLRELVKVMEADSSIGIAQSMLIAPNGEAHIGVYMECDGKTEVKKKGLMEQKGVIEVFSGIGAAIIIHRDLFMDVGGFDPDFFIIHEDVDLSWRVRLKGYRVVCVLASKVHHKWSASMVRLPDPFIVFHMEKNRIIMLIKNYSSKNLLRYLPLCIAVHLAKIKYAIRNRRFNIAKAHVEALAWNFTNFKLTWKKHLQVQRFIRKVPDGPCQLSIPVALRLLSLVPFIGRLAVKR